MGKRPFAAVSEGEGDQAQRVAELVSPPHDPAVFARLGESLRAGRLVAFPTETVYGLGANGLDKESVLKIFSAKGRPLNDPCILHVAEASAASQLLSFSAAEPALGAVAQDLFDVLTTTFWPGPLSLVGPATEIVPPEVTASTGFVAVRCPKHPVALELLRAAAVPLAAPSANRFGHISPTRAEHVLEDLGHIAELSILDGGPCDVGVESTVAKIELEGPGAPRLRVLRRGGVTREDLLQVLEEKHTQGLLPKIEVDWPEPRPTPSSSSTTNGHSQEDDTKAFQAPGMMLKHYSPSVPTVLLSPPGATKMGSRLSSKPDSCVLIDCGSQLGAHQALFLKTFELLPEQAESTKQAAPLDAKAKAQRACSQVFATLREAETVALDRGAELICLVDFSPSSLGGFEEVLQDKLFRAAAGKRAVLALEGAPHLCEPQGL